MGYNRSGQFLKVGAMESVAVLRIIKSTTVAHVKVKL
jgi:hypothetical protein